MLRNMHRKSQNNDVATPVMTQASKNCGILCQMQFTAGGKSRSKISVSDRIASNILAAE
jgi:hypothetical protein